MNSYVDGFNPARPSRPKTYIRRQSSYAARPPEFHEDISALITKTEPLEMHEPPESEFTNDATPSETMQDTVQDFSLYELQLPEMDIDTPRMPRRSKYPARFTYGFMLLAAFAAFGAGMLAAYYEFRNDRVLAVQYINTDEAATAIHGPDDVAEEPVSEESLIKHIVAPDMPRILAIPKLSVVARIVPTSVDEKSGLKAPQNIFDAGWYDGSAKPGSYFSAMLLHGHVSGPTRPGIFAKLHTLVPGDLITVRRGDGQVFNYRVASKEMRSYANMDMAKALSSVQADKAGLNLVTGAGKYLPEQERYEQSLVVYTVEE